MRGNPELAAWGRESLERAAAVYVGSAHIREVLEDVVGHVDRVHEVPPGVDVDEFRPRGARRGARARCSTRLRDDPPNPGNANERLPDEGNAERLARWFASDEPTVLYFGKLLYNKGVHVLFDALRKVDARAVVVGFGDYREELESERAAAHTVHGRARPPPSRAPDPALRRDGRAVDLPRGVRDGRRRVGGRRHAAARRAGTPGSPRSPRASRPSTRRSTARWRASRRGDVDDLAEKLEALLALPPTSDDGSPRRDAAPSS